MDSDVYPICSLHKLVLNLLAEIQQVDKSDPLFNVNNFGPECVLGYVVHFANRFFSHMVHSGTHKATPLSIFSPVGIDRSLHTDIPCSPL